MHRFMRHLDDLAGLDVHFDRERRADAIVLPRVGIDGQGPGLAAMLRRAMGRGEKATRVSICRDDRRSTSHPDPASLAPSADHALQPSLNA